MIASVYNMVPKKWRVYTPSATEIPNFLQT